VRTTSLITLFALFLATALPTFLLATKPTLNSSVFLKIKTTKNRPTNFDPSEYILLNSLDFKVVYAGFKPLIFSFPLIFLNLERLCPILFSSFL